MCILALSLSAGPRSSSVGTTARPTAASVRPTRTGWRSITTGPARLSGSSPSTVPWLSVLPWSVLHSQWPSANPSSHPVGWRCWGWGRGGIGRICLSVLREWVTKNEADLSVFKLLRKSWLHLMLIDAFLWAYLKKWWICLSHHLV